jgi:hypothetical protein
LPDKPTGGKMGLSKDAKSFTKITLDESEMPTQWYNIIPDLPSPPPPPLHPGTHQPVGPADLAPLFPMDLILQEVSTESYIDIPGEVLTRMFNNPFSTLYSIVTTAAYWWAIRWISKTAETAGRSYVGFMILSIVCLPIAWTISLTFKNSNSNVTTGD